MNFLINFYVNWQKQLTLNVLHSMEVWDRLSLVLIELNLCSISSVGVQGVEGWRGGLCEHGEVFGEGLAVSQRETEDGNRTY